MAFQNIVYLAASYGMAYGFFVSFFYFFDNHDLSFVCFFLKGLQQFGLSFHAHVPAVAAVMVASYCLQATYAVLLHQMGNMLAITLAFSPSARISSAFSLASARLSLFVFLAKRMAFISASVNLYLLLIFITIMIVSHFYLFLYLFIRFQYDTTALAETVGDGARITGVCMLGLEVVFEGELTSMDSLVDDIPQENIPLSTAATPIASSITYNGTVNSLSNKKFGWQSRA